MKILLTGGAGFIASHTAVELLLSGYEVILADNFSNSSPDVVNRIGKIVNKKVPIYNLDVSNGYFLEQVFKSNAIDAVIHFAGCKAVGESLKEPVKYYRNNLDTTLTLLEIMAKHNVIKLIFSSSAAVYGNPETVPITEDMPVGCCCNPYGRTKYFIEQILTDASRANPVLSVVLLRYFNPIGAHESGLIGEKPSGIPSNLMPYITQVAAGIRENLCIFGNDYDTPDGTGIRDYIHVVDLAKGHVAAIKFTDNHQGIEVFNLGTGVGYSVLDMIRAFEKAADVRVPYEIAPRRLGDIAACFAEPSKAKRVLGWEATKSIEDMCRDSWRWQQSQNS